MGLQEEGRGERMSERTGKEGKLGGSSRARRRQFSFSKYIKASRKAVPPLG